MYEINDPDRMIIAVKTDAGNELESVNVTGRPRIQASGYESVLADHVRYDAQGIVTAWQNRVPGGDPIVE